MKAIALFVALGLAILAGTIGAYLALGGSIHGSDLPNFGTFVGGVGGALLNFLALIALVWTIRLQYELLERDRERQVADQHVRWLDASYSDIQGVLDEAFPVSGANPSSLRAVLHGEAPPEAAGSDALKTRLVELTKLLAHYCEAVALYRDNVSPYFDLKIFVDRGARLLDRIKPFHAQIGNMSPLTIEFCDMHLHGEKDRKQAQALNRSSRP